MECPLKKAIPPHFQYISVEWGYEKCGLAHTIEDETKIDNFFAYNVVAGMLNKDEMRSRNKIVDASIEKERVLKFKQGFNNFDWTQYI